VLDGPIHRPPEYIRVVVIHAEDEAAVDHDAKVVQALRDDGIVAAEVLALVAAGQVGRRQRLEPDEDATESRLRRPLDEVAAKNRVDGRGALEETVHPAHAAKQRGGKLRVSQQVVVEKVEVASRQPIDLRQRVVHPLGIERPASVEERVLVAEVAVLRTSARDDDGVRDEVPAANDQVAPDGRDPIQRAARGRDVASRWGAPPEVLQELRKRLLAWAKKDCVGVSGGLVGQRRDVQSAERHERSACAIRVGQPVRAAGVGDVDLNHHEIRPVVELQRRHVLVFEHGFVAGRQIRGQGGEAERRKERVLDGPPVRAGRLGEGGEDEPGSNVAHTSLC
jgi:hypothetical protein